MTQDIVLIATGVTYYHLNDEAAFFEWLDRLRDPETYWHERMFGIEV